MSDCCILNIPLAQFDFAYLSQLLGESGQSLVVAASQSFFLLCLTYFILQTFVRDFLRHLKKGAGQSRFIHAETRAIEKFFNRLARTLSIVVWMAAVVICLRLLGFSEGAITLADWLFRIALAIALSHLLVQALPILIATLDVKLLNASKSGDRKLLYFYPEFRSFLPLLEQCLKLIIYAGTAGIILRYSSSSDGLAQYANQTAIAVFIYFLAQVAIEAAGFAIDRGVDRRINIAQTRQSDRQRWQTLLPISKDLCKYLIYLGLIVCVLTLFKVNISLVLASIGSLGVVFSLSVQNLVEDSISGLIIIFDESYLVGDYIKAGRLEERPVEGIVEAIELRTTRVRHPSGQLQLIRNSSIGSVVNYSKQYAYATVDVELNPGKDIDEIYGLIEQVGRSLAQKYPDAVKASTQIEGLESLSKRRVVIRTITKVYPGQHQYIQRLLRQRLKSRFEALEQEQRDKAYAAQFNESGIRSLLTSKRSLKGDPIRVIEQTSGMSAPEHLSPEIELESPAPSAQEKRKVLRKRSSVKALFGRILNLFRTRK